jgi:hypothetical protein
MPQQHSSTAAMKRTAFALPNALVNKVAGVKADMMNWDAMTGSNMATFSWG